MPLTTTHQLLEALQLLNAENEAAESPEYFKYVIYARKSTKKKGTDDRQESQARSLPDQLNECQELANKNNLKVVDIIQEAESAKESGIRPKFNKMINDIKQGKYCGIIAWHPDRLARNMKEAGEIIDMLDKEIIKDIRFVSAQFSNDATGKMLLAIQFALSKQYSDKLSTDILRGIGHGTKEGKWFGSYSKHGYFKDINDFLRPDGESFIMLKEAWKQKLAGHTYEEIAAYMNKNHYQRRFREGEFSVAVKMTKQTLSKIFKDTFYCGILRYGKNAPVDLTQVYDFEPMVTVEDFMQINRIRDISKTITSLRHGASKGSKRADLVRGMVFCDLCGQRMSAGIPNSRNKKKKPYLYYRCDTRDCERKGKSVRARVILEFVYKFLRSPDVRDRKFYEHYVKQAKEKASEKAALLQSGEKSLNSKLDSLKKRLERSKSYLIGETEEDIKDMFKDDLKGCEKEIKQVKERIAEVKQEKQKLKEGWLTYEEFIELFGNLASVIEKIDKMENLDKILRNIFLNFYIRNDKVVSYALKTPFKELFEGQKSLKVLSGGARGT